MSSLQKARTEIRGLVLNMPVPFLPRTFEVNHPGLRSNVDFWIERGVRVIMITHGTSDFACMSEEEIHAVTRTVVEHAAGRAHVIACTGLWWLGQTIRFAHFCRQIGADSLMVVKQEPVNATPEDYYAFHKAVADAVELPLVYHHCLTGPKSAEVVRRVADVPAVVAMKQETNEYQQYSLLRDTLGGRWNVIAGGGGELAFVAHQFGAVGCLTGIGQWAPGPELAFVDSLLNGRFSEARTYLDRALPFRRVAASINNHLAIKYMMDRVGLAGGPPRPLCMLPLTEAQEKRIETAAREAGLLG